MGKIFTLLYGVILAGGVAAAVLSIWFQRYDYRQIQFPRGELYILQHDRWTGRDCIAYSNRGTWVYSDVESCEIKLTLSAAH